MKDILVITWIAAPVIMGAVILRLLVAVHRERTETAAERCANTNLRRTNAALRQQLAALHIEAQATAAAAARAQELITSLERRLDGYDTDAELAAARQRIAYLSERNTQLTLQALANAGKIIRYYAH